MLNKQTFHSIQSGPDTEVYSNVTNLALYLATGGFLEAANQLLAELWKYKLPHDRNTWLADTAFMVLWNAEGSHPGFIPFSLDDIGTIEKNMRGYIAKDKWAYKMPDKPWTELTGQDLLRKALITAAMVKGDGSRPLGLEAIMNPPPFSDPANPPPDYMAKIARYLESHTVQSSDHFPSSGDELEALAMLEKLATEKTISSEGFALGAELAARNGKIDVAIYLAKLWANGYHEHYLSYNFPLLACSRHIAPLLLHKIIAEELKLSESVVREFLSQAITLLDRRMQQGRSLVYGALSWTDLLIKISQASSDFIEKTDEETSSQVGWIGFQGADANEIAMAEKRLGISLPEDYKHFLQISNGIRSFSSIASPLLPVGEIDLISNILGAQSFTSLLNSPVDEVDIGSFRDCLSRGIMISSPDEQMVWLIPSTTGNTTSWETWLSAAYWLPGEQRYPGFRFYMEDRLQICLTNP